MAKDSSAHLRLDNIKALFEKAPTIFCIIRVPDLVYEYVNPAHVKFLGGQDLTGTTILSSNPELAGSEILLAINDVIRSADTIVQKEYPFAFPDRTAYLDLTYSPRKNSVDQVDGIFVVGIDVTEKITALKNAEKSEAQMRLITNKLPAFVSYTDKEGRYQYMNEKYATWFNKPVSEMLGKTRDEVTNPEYAIKSKPYQKQVLDGETPQFEGTVTKSTGESLDLDIYFISDLDPETKAVRGMVAVGLDITPQKTAVREAELARRELHEVFMQAPAPMCLLTGPDHVFTMANPLYIKLLGREVMGKKLSEVFADEDITYYLDIIELIYETGEPVVVNAAVMDLHKEDGSLIRRYIDVGYQPYKDVDGKIKGVLVIVQDVTSQVTALTARDNFISIASHELKTPITSMKLQAQMFQKMLSQEGIKIFDEERLQKIFENNLSQIDRLARLVDDMLDGTRLSTNSFKMRFTNVNFSKLINDIFEAYEPQFKAVGITLDLQIDPGITLPLDESRIEQVIINLITNAIRYAPHKPVHVKLHTVEKSVCFTMRDEGIGIDPKDHEKVFERFERVKDGRDVTGLGLGLFIARQIVERHGGIITLNSALDQGSEFVVSLPLN